MYKEIKLNWNSVQPAVAKFFLPFSFTLFILSITYISDKVFFIFSKPNLHGLDFRYIWLAGRLWIQRENPYDNLVFGDTYKHFFGFNRLSDNGSPWSYPPTWAPISMFFGSFSFEQAEILWRGITLLLLIGIVILTALWLNAKGFQISLKDARVWLGASYLFLLQSTSFTISIGQTSILFTFGVVLLLYAASRRNLLLTSISVYFLLLKPQLALVILITLIIGSSYRIVIWGMVLTFFALILSFARSGVTQTISGFLVNLSLYSRDILNLPPDLTGVINLVDYYMSIELNSKILMIPAMLIGVGCGLIMRRSQISFWGNRRVNTEHPDLLFLYYFILMIAITGFLMPLHIYDFIIYGPAMIVSLFLPIRQTLLLMPGLLLIFRPSNLAEKIQFYHPDSTSSAPGSLIASTSALFLLIGITILLAAHLRTSVVHNEM
jgi:hypothetical protein